MRGLLQPTRNAVGTAREKRILPDLEEINPETRAEKTETTLSILRKARIMITREEVEKKRKETRGRKKGKTRDLTR